MTAPNKRHSHPNKVKETEVPNQQERTDVMVTCFSQIARIMSCHHEGNLAPEAATRMRHNDTSLPVRYPPCFPGNIVSFQNMAEIPLPALFIQSDWLTPAECREFPPRHSVFPQMFPGKHSRIASLKASATSGYNVQHPLCNGHALIHLQRTHVVKSLCAQLVTNTPINGVYAYRIRKPPQPEYNVHLHD